MKLAAITTGTNSGIKNDAWMRTALPDDHLVALQVDRGPLDPRAIGGSIALSGFAPPEKKSDDVHDLENC